jgi:ATP-dependent RNA helicase DeaD
MRQQARNTVMARFRSGSVNILIATDVAARGIDVENVEAVFNYDIPQDLEYYVHRIGRTGRAGKTGMAFTFVTNRDRGALREIENYTKVRIEKALPPTSVEIVAARKERFMSQLQEAIAAEGQEEFTNWVSELNAEGLSSDAIAAALLRLNHKDVNKQIAEYDFAGRSAAPRGERTFESRDRNDRGDARRDGRSSDRREVSRDRDSRSSDRFADRNSNSSRPDARPRRTDGPSAPRSNENMVRLFLSVGRKDNVRPGDIVGAIAGESGIGGDKIGAIDIYDKFSFVNIPSEHVNSVLSVMTDNTIRGQKVSMEVAK